MVGDAVAPSCLDHKQKLQCHLERCGCGDERAYVIRMNGKEVVDPDWVRAEAARLKREKK